MITIIGSLNCDFVTYVKNMPGPGETFQGEQFELHLGGKGLNEAIAAGRLSSPETSITEGKGVRIWGKVGDDMYGRQMLKALNEAGCDMELVEVIEDRSVSSGTATILVETEKGGENRIVIVSGANAYLKPTAEEYSERFANAREGDFLMLQNEYPNARDTIDWVSREKPMIKIAYNPSPFKPEWVTKDILGKIDYLFLNLGEAKEVLASLVPSSGELNNGSDSIQNSTKTLCTEIAQALGSKTHVVITMGAHGVTFTNEQGESEHVAGLTISGDKVVDTTGAGDTFMGGVISQLDHGLSMAQAVRFGCVASALGIQTRGAAESIPLYDEVIDYAKVNNYEI